MSDQISETVPETAPEVVVETKLEGGSVEAAPEVQGELIKGGNTPAPVPEAAAPAVEAAAAESTLAGGELEGGSRKRRKTRRDKGKSRGKYSSKPSSKLRKAISMLENTPGGEAVYVEGTAMKCRRGHRYSRRHGVCVKHIGGSPRKLRSYNRHRKESGMSLKSSRKRRSHRKRRSKSRSRSHGRRTRSGKKY